MPGRDGTGPAGTGRGAGRSKGQGRGRMGGPYAAGPGGNCICPNCGHQVPHVAGRPCSQMACPECGVQMSRQ